MNYPTIFPELSTERLTLRQLSFKDKKAIFKLRSNKIINKLIKRETPKNLNDADVFIQNCLNDFENKSSIFWVIQHQKTNKVIGTIVFHDINLKDSYAKIGYELNPDYQKEGFMDESMKTILDFNFNTLQLKIIEAFTHQNNNDSTALLEKHQFILQANRKDNLIDSNNIFRLDINPK